MDLSAYQPAWTEAERLAALHNYAILDTPNETEFDDITQMAAQACGCPISTLNLIDRDRQWYKAEVGVGVRQVPLSPSLCIHALEEMDCLVVPDTGADPRLADNPLVVGSPYARFYAGVPLRTPEGLPIGVLCVVDQRPRELSEQQLFILKALARAVIARLEQRKAIAERDRALEAERRTGERIELALNTGAILGTWVWDIALDQFTGDSRFAATCCRDPAEFLAGMPLAEVLQCVHPEDLARVESLIGQAMAEGGQYRAEYRVRRPDGAWRWIEANGACHLDVNGRAIRFPGVLVDIDNRKRQELRQAALIELGNNLRLLREPAAIAAAASATLGETLGVTRTGYGIVDAAGEAVEIGDDWRANLHIVSLAGRHIFWDFGSFIDDLKQGEVVAIADVGRDPRTRSRAAAFEAIQICGLLNVPLMDEGRIAAVVLAHSVNEHPWTEEEITFARAVADRTWAAIHQAQAEAELLRINEGLEAEVAERTQERDGIWNASQDLLGVADTNGVWLSVNPAWTKLLSWRREEIIGRTSDWMEHPSDCAVAWGEIAHLAQGERTISFENRFSTRDGGYRDLAWVAVPVKGKLYCSARNITEQKAATEALARTEQALRQSQKMEAVGQLTGGLAHDFNNLLTGITGALELLNARLAQGRYKEVDRYVQSAQGAAKRAAALTHRLLAFSRQQTLDPKPTDANRLIAGMEDLLRRTVGPAIEVVIVEAEGLWPTLVDQNQLENAVLNLCINARDAMQDGGRLSIEAANVGSDASARNKDLPVGEYVTISVTDTGTGMSPEVVAKAFDPFFTTKPLGQGTGLGLSMIYGFAQQSGGHVRIHSQVGVGTTMRLYLPRYFGLVQNAEAASKPAEVTHARQGETVLVVDDESTIRMLVMEVLEELGYAAIEAADGASGLAVLRSGARVDLLVTDVGLPGGMNGRQMADMARTSRPDLKVLFITGYAEAAVFGNGHLDRGMYIMTKPFALKALSGRIKELIVGP